MTAGIAAVMTVYLGTHVAWPWYTVVGSLTTLVWERSFRAEAC